MDLSVSFVSLLFVPLLFINICHGNQTSDIQRVNVKLLELENEILELKEANCRHEQETKELSRLSVAPSVSFRSFLSNTVAKMSIGQLIVFDQVDLNIGKAYNRHSGVFTAPYNGTYIFSMAVGNPPGKIGNMYMVQSHGIKKTVIEYAFAGHTSGWNMGGVTSVARLTAGESVWVEGEGHISGSYPTARYHSGFSGVLISKG